MWQCLAVSLVNVNLPTILHAAAFHYLPPLQADKISERHGNLNTKTGKLLTTVRGTDRLPTPMKMLTRAYAFYQFSAIVSALL